MKKLSYILLLFCFAACQSEPEIVEEATPLLHTRASSLHFAQTENLDLNALGIIGPSKMIKKDSLYVLLTPKSKYRLAIYNSVSGSVHRLIPAGSGEGQGMYFLNLRLDGDVVSTFDYGTGRLIEINLTQYALTGYQPTFTILSNPGKLPLGAIRAGNNIISTGIYTEGRYCCSDLANGTNTYSVGYPECAAPSLSDSLKSIFYASNCLAVNPAHTRLACANMQYGCLDICDISGKQLSRVNEVHLTRPGVVFQHKRPRGNKMWYPVSYTRNNLFGFCDLTTSEEHIFALYSGRTYREYKGNVDKGRTIFVFDWNGSHVRTYHLSNTCSSISYDKATDAIYALSQEKGKAEVITLNLE